jgi:hypothetical protein
MFGDLGAAGTVTFIVRGGTHSTPTARVIRVPASLSRGSFKISDNDSPRPVDRVFLTYNYYDGVRTPDVSFNVNREVLGFEKTFLGGDASFEMRLPFLQFSNFSGPEGIVSNEVADLTMILKYAVINDRSTGDVLSGGLAVTVPTAQHGTLQPDGSEKRSTLFQPYVGWIINRGDWYAHAFHAVVVSTDSEEPTLINNDVGIGYWLAKNDYGFFRGIVPTVEAHLLTPVDHRSSTDQFHGIDILTFTAGVNFVLPRATLGTAIAVTVTGPSPNRVEAILSFNYRF